MIKTHNDLVNKLHNVESLDFAVFYDKKPHIIIETKGKMYRVIHLSVYGYVIEEVLNYKFHTVKKGQRPPVLEAKELVVVDTPQEVYDYFKPFMR